MKALLKGDVDLRVSEVKATKRWLLSASKSSNSDGVGSWMDFAVVIAESTAAVEINVLVRMLRKYT